ncbi:MAG TPA: NADH-quinone oxidoreductase subunit N [Candidatus Marinimicrobia bacterium]|nr:NADH-quinone oxidoreductase subunit N [Candidatus Neomarinimicrobiota bacterium]
MDLSQYFTSADLAGIAPEIILTIAALFVLTLEMARLSRPGIMLFVAAMGIVLAGGALAQAGGEERVLFGGMLRLNSFSIFLDFLYLAVGLATLILSQGYLEKKGNETRGEYPALILFAVIGMMLMTQANDLVMVFLGLELLSLSLYVLVGFLRHDIYSNESGLKYLLLGAFATGFFLFGAALTYGATGTTNFDGIASAIDSGDILSHVFLSLGIGLLLIGFAFKVALAPFHMWSPDVYQGAPTTVTGFLCTAPKAAGFGALMKVFMTAFPEVHDEWQTLFWIMAALTMTVGNISALVQSNVKRMLAFSSISHAGYLAMGVLVLDSNSVGAMLFYLAVYSAMNLGAFAIIAVAEREEQGVAFEDYRGLASRHPWFSAAIALFLISLAGFPPTAGFVAKYGLFSVVIAKGYIWLVIIAVLNTLVSVYYYLRLVVNMYMREEEEVLRPVTGIMVVGLIVLLVAAVLLFGIAPGFLLDITTTVIL